MKTLILIYLKMIQRYFFKNNIEISNDEKVFEDDIVYIQDLENNST